MPVNANEKKVGAVTVIVNNIFENLTYSSFCRLKSSLHSIFTHVSPIQYTFSTKLMV